MKSNLPSSIADALSFVHAAGKYAHEEQKKLQMAERQLKADQSVVTDIDREVGSYLCERIEDSFPQANVLGEEHGRRNFDPDAPTFAVDPIDGTDSYSQGMPGWTIAVGLLNRELRPIAGIVHAPAWDGTFFADVGSAAVYNDETLDAPAPPEQISRRTNLLVDSRIHLLVDLDDYPGKLRSLGSTALHVCGFLKYGAVIGAISRGVHVWDLAGAQAVAASLGQTVEYFDGGTVTYENMMNGEPAGDLILAGTATGKKLIRETFRRRTDAAS